MRALAALALAALLAGCAGTSYPRDRVKQALDRGINKASPGLIVARELAFARAAREDGQWTAFRAFAADDAVMFVPEPVNAREWLGKQEDPAEPVQWQPHQVWMSCDGSLAVTKGAWQRPNGIFGYFTTIWERQTDGEYKWVLDQGDELDKPLDEPDIIQSTVADCGDPEKGDGVTLRSEELTGRGDGASRDSSLTFDWAAYADGGRDLVVSLMKDNESKVALTSSVVASNPAQ